MLNSKLELESPEDYFSGALQGFFSSQHELCFGNEDFIVKPIILILAPNTYDKRTYIELSVVNDDKVLPHSLNIYF